MGEGATKIFSHQNLKDIDSANRARIGNWVIMEGGDGDDIQDSESMESSYEDSASSVESSSSSSSELMEDASSSSTSYSSPSSSSSHSNGPLYELSELMSQLPIKRGLSKHYQGKSQSYTSLASVKSLDDLAKKEKPYTQRIKSCKSYAGGLDGHKFYTPKATITKKTSRGSFTSLLGSSRGTLMTICKPPTSAQKNF